MYPSQSAQLLLNSFSQRSSVTLKMIGGSIITGWCLLLLFSFTECGASSQVAKRQSAFCNLTDTDSELYKCTSDFREGSSSVCQGSCRSVLRRYADTCLQPYNRDAASEYKDDLKELCASGPTLLPTLSAILLALSLALY
jgi:hypothetical protein